MRQIIFTPKWENGKQTVRKPKIGEAYQSETGNFVIAQPCIIYESHPIFTRSEVEIPDPEPVGWKFMKTGEVRKVNQDEWYFTQHGTGPFLWQDRQPSYVANFILSCTPIYEGDV